MKAQENVSLIKIISNRDEDIKLIKKLQDERINVIAEITLRYTESYINGRNTAADRSL